LIEGNVDEIESITENPLVFYGAVSSIAIDFKIPIIHTPDATHTSKLLVSMSSRKESTQGPFLKKIRKSNNIQQQQLSALCSLPGVGQKTAKRMLAKFGSPVKVFTASLVELSKIEGLGAARAKKIKNMLEKKSYLLKKSNQKTLHD